jgi:DNA-directed RNA polymerase subunit RPC12/RpoP
MANSAARPSGFVIEVGCPGCGGALSLQEDFATIRCQHCSSALRVIMPDLPPAYLIKPKVSTLQVRFHLDQYLKEQGRQLSPPEIEISGIYHPYWKINSLLLRVRNRIETRTVVSNYGKAENYEEKEELRQDVSLTPHLVTVSASPAMDLFPYSLGLRTEYIKLHPWCSASDEENFTFTPIVTTVIQAYAQAEKVVQKLSDASNLTNKRNLSKLFGLKAALVYFPYHQALYRENEAVTTLLLDAVSGRVVGDSGVPAAGDHESSQRNFGALKIDFHRCSNCGEDLPTTNSILYCCKNCGSVTTLETHTAFDRNIALTNSECSERDLLLPFWLMDCQAGVESVAGRASDGDTGSRPLVVPAFQVANFEALYRLTCRLTTALPKLGLCRNGEVKRDIAPANVGLQEAIILAHAAVARGELKQNPQAKLNTEFAMTRAQLLLVPFHAESYFLVDSVISAVTIERRAMTAAAS